MQNHESNISQGQLLCIVGKMKHHFPDARVIRPNHTIDHDAKEIVLDPDYEALHNACIPELKFSFFLAWASVIAFAVWLVEFA